MTNITELQLKQLAYIDNAIKNSLTSEQKEIIEDKEIAKSKKRLHRKITNKIKNAPRVICLHNRDKIKEENMTEEMIEREIGFWFDNH